jgi:hypothetical protein
VCSVGAAQFESALEPARVADAATGADLSDPSLPVAADLDALISQLEADWLRDLINMNASTLRTEAFNWIPPASISTA